MDKENFEKAVTICKNAQRIIAITGAGISISAGIPPFRGKNGFWEKYDPIVLDINFFKKSSAFTWKVVAEVFFKHMKNAVPTLSHRALARLEEENKLGAIITQNIDNLHQLGGSKNVIDFHGTTATVTCTKCKKQYPQEFIEKVPIPPHCPECKGLIKPDILFFGEKISEQMVKESLIEIARSDVMLVIGTSGAVNPINSFPGKMKENRGTVIEINISSKPVFKEADIYLCGNSDDLLPLLVDETLKD